MESNDVLNSPWNIWYHQSLDDWTINGYKKLFTINTIADFWNFHNNVDCLGGITNMHFFMMRDNITPIWEDLSNRNGGNWSILVPVEEAPDLWIKICANIIGETICENHNMLINGISINQKNNISIFKIWNNDKNIKDNNIMPSYLHKYNDIIYRPHKITY
jgi:translation initiation factor 4E